MADSAEENERETFHMFEGAIAVSNRRYRSSAHLNNELYNCLRRAPTNNWSDICNLLQVFPFIVVLLLIAPICISPLTC